MSNRAAIQETTPLMGGDSRARRANRFLACRAVLLGAMLLTVSGCPEPQTPDLLQPDAKPLAPLPLDEAVNRINNQMNLIDGGLQASGGFAKGYFTDVDGKRRSFNHDAALLVLPPRFLRFDMKVLGSSVMLLGSNATRYWLATKMDDDALWWGRHNRAGSLNIRGVTLQPATMIEAIGVGAIPTDPPPVQRVTRDHQQLIVTGVGPDGNSFIEKEYWLSRRPGRNLVRILMRTPGGEVAMDANLTNHELVREGGPSIPRRIEIDWPTAEGQLIFTCRSWKIQPRVDRAFAGFAFPLDRGEKFERIVDIDREYGTPLRTRRPGSTADSRPTARRAEEPPGWPTREAESGPADRPPGRAYDQSATDARRQATSDAQHNSERRPDYRDQRRYESDPASRFGPETPPAPDGARPSTRRPPSEPQPQAPKRRPEPQDKSDRSKKPKDPNVWWDPDRS